MVKNILVIISAVIMSLVVSGCSAQSPDDKYTYQNNPGCEGGVKSKYICRVYYEPTTMGKMAGWSKSFAEFKRINNLSESITRNTPAPANIYFAAFLRNKSVSKPGAKKYYSYTDYRKSRK